MRNTWAMEEKDDKSPGWKPLWIMAGLLTTIWIVYGVLVWHSYKGDDRGIFGDMFGGLNALFSAFAFAALIYTVVLQRKELEYQRLELKQTRKAMEASAKAQVASEETLRKDMRIHRLSSQLEATVRLIEWKLAHISHVHGQFHNCTNVAMWELDKMVNHLEDRKRYRRLNLDDADADCVVHDFETLIEWKETVRGIYELLKLDHES